MHKHAPRAAYLLGLLVFAVFAVGCVHYYPQRFAYKNLPPNMKIAYASPERVDAHCRRVKKGQECHYDDGTPCTNFQKIKACYNQAKNFMWVGYGNDSSIPHELCHAEGRPTSECAKLHVKVQ
jgi:hypothetical protein